MFSHFGRTPTCDRRMDRHRATAHAALAQHLTVTRSD